jgi:hypothetical protein
MMNAGLAVYNPSHLLSINHYDRMSTSISERGKRKGNVSEQRETRIKSPDYYIYIDNLDDICDKYTESTAYVEMYKYRAVVSLSFKKTVMPLSFISTASSWKRQNKPTNSPFDVAGYWAPSEKDKQPYLECLLDDPCTIKILDIRGRPVDKDNLDYGYVSKFKLSYCTEEGWIEDATEYKGIPSMNGNLIKRTYVDLTCKGLRIYPLAFVGSLALKVRIFASASASI